MRYRYQLILSLIFIGLTPLGLGASERVDPFSAQFKDEVIQARPGETFQFKVKFKVPKNHYLYDDKTILLFDNKADFDQIQSYRPPAEDHYDSFFKKNLKVHFKDFQQTVFFKVPLSAKPGRRTLEAQLRYQGCSDDFCYRPVSKTVLLPVEVLPLSAQLNDATRAGNSKNQIGFVAPGKTEPSFWELLKESNPDRLLNQGKVYLLALALFGGILTSFTPCVLPLVPLTLAFIGVRHRRKGNLMRALTLVAGMVFMYSVLGFFVATLGLKLGFLFQSRIFLGVTAVFFFIFALGLFDIIPFHLPPKLHNKFAQMGGEGPVGTFVAGLTIGLIASPCVGPLIAPLLLIAARSQDRAYGFLLLLNYGVGMGLIFLVLATGWAEIQAKLKSGKWTDILKKGMAVLMLAPALYYGYAFAKPYLAKDVNKIWVKDFKEGMTQARQSGKPVLLDFYADWCPPCVELDKFTFSDPEVQQLGNEFIMLKIDCTIDDSNCREATSQYQVVGWPTVLFLKPDGEVIQDVNLVGGFADKDRMLTLMRRAIEKIK